MPTTSADLYYPSNANFSFGDPMPDYVHCYTDLPSGAGGPIEVQLPQVEGGGSARITIQNHGATYNVYVNPAAGETVAGSAGTFTVAPGQTVQLQGGPVGQGAYGWKVK